MALASGWARMRAWVSACVLVATTCVPWSTHAANLSPALQHGVDWLTAQVRSDGTLASESASIAVPLQAREESFVTLGLLATAPSALSASIAANTDTNLAYRARRMLAAGANGESDGADVAALLAQQNTDGGWGIAAGYQSNALDTAFALRALAAVHASAATAVGNALGYLAQARLADNGFGMQLSSTVFISANVLLGANAWSNQFPTATTVAGYARDWLLAQRNATQTFGSVLGNAIALRALATQTAQAAVLQPLTDALNAAQRSDGSWADDPYQTALALNALWFASQPSTAPTTGGVQGKVVDQTSGSAIAGATVQLVGSSTGSNTAVDGTFALSGIAPGGYSLQVSAAGYSDKTVTVQITAGQTLNLSSIAMAPQVLTANVHGVVTNNYGQVLSGVRVAVGDVAVLTDDNGKYQITGLTPGTVTVSASAVSYYPVTATVGLVGGTSYVFSPSLYPTYYTLPGSASLTGSVVDGATQKAIAGASVSLGATTQTTDASGNFSFSTVAIGAFSLTVSASGYQNVVASGVLGAGPNNVGAIPLQLLPKTSSLSGHVFDADTHAPIAAATLTVPGQNLAATSDASGAYAINNIVGTTLSLNVSAGGYASQVLTVNLPQIGNAVLDVTLAKPAASGIRFTELEMEHATIGPHDSAELEATLANSTANAASLTVQAIVSDAGGNIVFVLQAYPGFGVPTVNLPVLVPANGTLDAPMKRTLLRQAPGTYRVHAQAIDDDGAVVAEGDTQFTVTAEPILSGGLVPNPPLAQIGTGQPIALSTDLTNVGNQDIAAGNLDVRVTVTNPDSQALTTPVTSIKTLTHGLPYNGVRGLVTDAAGNLYTVNNNDDKILKLDPSGATSVVFTLPSYVRPLGLALDAQGNFWVTVSNGVWKVTPQGGLTPINFAQLDGIYALDVAPNGDLIVAGYAGAQWRLIRRTQAGTETVLWNNGLNHPQTMVKDGAGGYLVTNLGDGTVVRVSAAGAITPFASGFKSPTGIERDAQGNVYVANNADGTITKVAPGGQMSTFASGFKQPYDLRFDASGNLFVANYGDNSIEKVLPDGTVQVFARGLANGPEGMKYDAAGNLWIASDDGTVRSKDPAGNVSIVASGLSAPRGLAIDASGNVLVANYASGTVSKISGTNVSTFASGLASPYGVAIDGGGSVYVTLRGANRIDMFSAAGSPLGTIDSAVFSPKQAQIDAGGLVYVKNSNSITVIANGAAPRTLIDNFSSDYIAVDPVHGGLIAVYGTDLYRIAADGTKTHLNTTSLPFQSYGLGVDAAGEPLLLDYWNKRIQKFDSSGNLSLYASLPDYGQKLTTDLTGRATVWLVDGYTLVSIDTNGTVSQIPLTLNEYIYTVGTAQDGHVLIWTNYRRVYSIDPATGATTLLIGSDNNADGVTRDAAGTVYVVDSSYNELREYDAGGVKQNTLAGFYDPWDIVWTGTDLKFVDSNNQLFAFTPGSYPRRLGAFGPYYLAASNGEIYGTAFTGAGYGITHWNTSTGSEVWTAVKGVDYVGGIAARADGALTAGDNRESRVTTFDASKHVISDYAGIVQPTGLAFDAQGRLYVANYGSSTVGRFDPGSAIPTTLANEQSAAFVAIDPSGNVWVSRSNGVDRIDPAGVVTSVSKDTTFNALLFDGARAFVLDGNNSLMEAYDGTNWNVIAAGMSYPYGINAASNGDVYLANWGNGSVTRYSNGAMVGVGGGMPGVNAVHRFADGNVYAGSVGGALYNIAPDGTKTDLRLSGVVDYLSWYGFAPGADADTSYGVVSGYVNPGGDGHYDDQIVQIKVTQPPVPAPAGTVVYQTSVPMPAMPAIDGYTHLDLGAWLPPYGGDFRIDAARAGVPGGASNFVHVGPSAYGALTALEPELPPGDQTESMCLSLSGGDFTSLSRVETAQVRKLLPTEKPKGMTGDRAGNMYYITRDSLYRADRSGNTTQLAGGLTFGYGLATDDAENLYATTWDAAAQHFDLQKFDLNGNRTKIADLGVASANGVEIDSHGNIVVGSPGALLKVNPQGNVSLLSPNGIPDPRNIAIDGKDNVYVQNETGYVSMIKPDGSTTQLFTKNDGVEDPWFEGDGSPNIAADCSDNLYIAAYRWAKLGNAQLVGEEHTIAQIVQHTGHIGLVFDTETVTPNLSDIDFMAFDRLGSRILLWDDSGVAWQVPVTCGAIGVNAHVVTKPGQTITGATVPTTSVIAQADGGKEYVWSLKSVTSTGQQICFDTRLKGLQLGETRPTLASSYITFQNSFAPNDVQQQLNVPAVHVANVVNLNVVTDQADYPAQATAQVTTTLTNANPTLVEGALVVNVYDASGAFVGGVTRQNVSVPALGSLPVTAPFAIGAILPAQYTVTAVLSNNGLDLARGQATFDVLPNNATASATSFVHTDKQSYNPNDTVVIGSRAQSLSSNIVLSNLTLMVTVVDAFGTTQFTHGFPIVQLLPGATLDFSVPEKLSNAAPGIYTVKQDLLDDATHVLNHVEAAYNVASTSDTGFGLSGTIAAAPKSLAIGGTLTLTASATNQGNSALSNLPLTIALVDPATGTVRQSFTQNANVAVGATVPFTATWATTGTPGTTYFAVLSATVGTGSSAKTLTLAVDTYALTKPAFHLDATVSLSATPPPLAALVLVDSTASSAENTRIAQALNAVGYVSTFVASQADFANAMQSGAYQAYLLLATGVTPDATTQRLLREAVHRGEGLIVATGAAQLPDTLAQITGLAASSGLTAVNAQSIDTLTSAPGGAAHEAFNPALASRFVVTNLAQTLATQATRLSATPDSGTLASELALRGRVDVGYFGNDAGSGNTQLALASMGRLQNGSGAAIATAWRIRNSGTTARNVTLASMDGTYSLPFTIAAQTDTFIASPDVAGTATHKLSEGAHLIDTQAASTTVFSDTRLIDVGDNPGAIALWANAIGVSDTLDWSGAQHTLHGAVHSNGDIVLAGAQNLVDGPLNYATTFTNTGSQNTFTYLPRQVAPQPMPTPLDLDDFKPGGAVSKAAGTQYFDQTAECTTKHVWQRTGNKVTLTSGVYWIPCDVHIAGNSPNGTVSLVSTGAIQIDGSSPTFKPFYQGLQFATSLTGAGAIKLTGSSMQVGGYVFAPHGTVEASGSAMNIQCSIIADQIRLAGAKTTIDARQCAYATEQRQLPAVVWNAFGTGTAAYAAFDWQGAIGTYESAQPGVLAKLFGGVLAHIAPGSSALRAGTIVPLKLNVQSTADPFTGQLALAANDDSTFVPATTPWALDFTHQSTFTAQSNVRLGSGASTGLTATVSAATPIAINPLKQGTLSLVHLPGESIANLVTAFNALPSPDAALTAATTALQAAQASLAAGDRNGAVAHLLDAAEDCGNSGNAQADALRTRIDWVIWATTH